MALCLGSFCAALIRDSPGFFERLLTRTVLRIAHVRTKSHASRCGDLKMRLLHNAPGKTSKFP